MYYDINISELKLIDQDLNKYYLKDNNIDLLYKKL